MNLPAQAIGRRVPSSTSVAALDGPGNLDASKRARRTLSPGELGQLASAAAAATARWAAIAQFRPERRWYTRLALTDDYEVWLLTWLPGQYTGFHDHGNAAGAFAVAQGELRETRAAIGSRHLTWRVARAGSVTAFGGRHLHDVANVADDPAVSVHAYSPALSVMRRYEMTPSGLALAGTDRAELDW